MEEKTKEEKQTLIKEKPELWFGIKRSGSKKNQWGGGVNRTWKTHWNWEVPWTQIPNTERLQTVLSEAKPKPMKTEFNYLVLFSLPSHPLTGTFSSIWLDGIIIEKAFFFFSRPSNFLYHPLVTAGLIQDMNKLCAVICLFTFHFNLICGNYIVWLLHSDIIFPHVLFSVKSL